MSLAIPAAGRVAAVGHDLRSANGPIKVPDSPDETARA